jgi:hypothetical protein
VCPKLSREGFLAADSWCSEELQIQYSNFKETLQGIAQKIGECEQGLEEHS